MSQNIYIFNIWHFQEGGRGWDCFVWLEQLVSVPFEGQETKRGSHFLFPTRSSYFLTGTIGSCTWPIFIEKKLSRPGTVFHMNGVKQFYTIHLHQAALTDWLEKQVTFDFAKASRLGTWLHPWGCCWPTCPMSSWRRWLSLLHFNFHTVKLSLSYFHTFTCPMSSWRRWQNPQYKFVGNSWMW